MKKNESGIIVGVIDHSPQFLQYLDKIELAINARIKVKEEEEFDNSKTIIVNSKTEITVSQKVGKSLLVRRVK
jgi:DtxR family Mn-dependent transcriptional regulator